MRDPRREKKSVNTLPASLPLNATLEEARDWLRKIMWQKMVPCPCCKQDVKVYKRQLNRTMAKALIRLHFFDEEWVHVPSVIGFSRMGGDFAKMGWFGLVEEKDAVKEDGNPHAGYWRIKELGRDFVREAAKVPAHIFIYNNRILKKSEEQIGIRQALGKKFNYDELMAAALEEKGSR
jgi:hypothetical protein